MAGWHSQTELKQRVRLGVRPPGRRAGRTWQGSPEVPQGVATAFFSTRSGFLGFLGFLRCFRVVLGCFGLFWVFSAFNPLVVSTRSGDRGQGQSVAADCAVLL